VISIDNNIRQKFRNLFVIAAIYLLKYVKAKFVLLAYIEYNELTDKYMFGKNQACLIFLILLYLWGL
jgi:hypothetical protein